LADEVDELAPRNGIMQRILPYESRFHRNAYLFVLAALEYRQSRLARRRHVSGAELAFSCRDLALERYGLMARLVLEHWGIRSTADLGDIVFTLVDHDLLMRQDSDCREEYIGVYDFDQAFEREYPWSKVYQT
jgi:uncharacterized repeat protein (TIGR04138 family)